jgi:hypothetical protein
MKTLDAGSYVLAGAAPLCRPATVYRVALVRDLTVELTVVHSPASARMAGEGVCLPRVQFDAAWRLGDVRVVPAWSAPTETLREATERLLDRGQGRRRRPRAAVLTGAGAL